MRVLYVCTANICRSASAEAMLRDAGVPGVEVMSAGTLAASGSPGCPMAPALEGRATQHRSQRLTQEMITAADLVLTAAREHGSEVLAAQPAARSRTFTIRQSGRLARWVLDMGLVDAARLRQQDPQGWAEGIAEGDPRRQVAPLPADEAARTRWLVEELDAARGMAPTPVPEAPVRKRGRRAADPEVHPDDVPDPHVLGTGWHGPAYEQIREATGDLVAVLRAISP